MDSNKMFTAEKAFKAIDDWNYGYIDKTNLKSFMRKHGRMINDDQLLMIIRRMDLDADARVSKEEFIEGLKPEQIYSKLMKREQSKDARIQKHGHQRSSSCSNLQGTSYKYANTLKKKQSVHHSFFQNDAINTGMVNYPDSIRN
jgi:hypothetical protein